jgi:AcrR family transcriptional regulator
VNDKARRPVSREAEVSPEENMATTERGRLRKQQQRAVATQGALLVAARSLFATAGYHAAGTHELVALASVSRGALYHHFGDKEGLFEAVLRQVSHELSERAARSVARYSGDPWRQLMLALRSYLELVAGSPEAQRIVLIDGPAVLGWERWRAIRAEGSFQGFVHTLDMLIERRLVAPQPKEPLAQLILAAMNEAALAIAHSPAPTGAQKLLTEALLALIDGLRIRDRPAGKTITAD